MSNYPSSTTQMRAQIVSEIVDGQPESERQSCIAESPALRCAYYMCEMEGDMAVHGYARVSTDGQSLSAQLAELKAAKCGKIFQEKISGARSDRKQLTRLMAVLAKGD